MDNILEVFDNDGFFLHLIIADILANGIPRRIYIRSDHFNGMPDLEFFQHFRLRKETVLQLLPALENRLEYIHDLNNSVSPINQLLICLRYYATGCHQRSLAFFGGVEKSTANRIVHRVTRAICHISRQYIHFPATRAEQQTNQLHFFQLAGFPRVFGVIDGCHVKIQSPGGADAEIFRNRKTYFSLNIQAIVNSSYQFMDLVARWPGSTHDMTIFNNSVIKGRCERNEFGNAFLLGDSGYAVKNYLMTPLLQPHNGPEAAYNESLVRTRVIVENAFGIWKRRFPIMAYGCRTKVDFCMMMVLATATLHNIARAAGEELPPNPPDHDEALMQRLLDDGEIGIVVDEARAGNRDGFRVRRELIANYFAR